MRVVLPPLPQYVFMARCSVKHRDNFTFTSEANGDFQNYMAMGGSKRLRECFILGILSDYFSAAEVI
jgi:hypothetical protein